ncbi:MAG: cation transporter [Planctomycetales bacterium]|nr:cation transporter [Planctomycetales bacterium]
MSNSNHSSPDPTTEGTEERTRLYRDAARAASVGLAVNGLLLVIKFGGGLLTGSLALIADAVNSLGDVTGSIVVRGGLSFAQRDADEEHPYGHTKAESIAALTVTLLIIFSAVALGTETIRTWGTERGEIEPLAAWLAAGASLTKELLFRYTRASARKFGSASLRAAAWDHRSDALASGAVAIALAIAASLGPNGWMIDPLAAVAVCGVLVWTGVRVYRETAAELMDQQAPPETVDEIAAIANGFSEVRQVEKLRVRKSGLEFFVEIHLEVDGDLTVEHGHRVGHQVKDAVMNQLSRVRDVHVHIEPYPGQD